MRRDLGSRVQMAHASCFPASASLLWACGQTSARSGAQTSNDDWSMHEGILAMCSEWLRGPSCGGLVEQQAACVWNQGVVFFLLQAGQLGFRQATRSLLFSLCCSCVCVQARVIGNQAIQPQDHHIESLCSLSKCGPATEARVQAAAHAGSSALSRHHMTHLQPVLRPIGAVVLSCRRPTAPFLLLLADLWTAW